VSWTKVFPAIKAGEGAGDQSSVNADIGKKRKKSCHEDRTRSCLTIDVRDQETEQRIKNVAAGYDRILVGEIKGEGENGSQVEREGREAQKDIDSGGGNDGRYPTEDEIADVKMSGNPKDEIPERRMTLVSKAVQQKLGQAEIACEKPGLRFVVPRLMPGNREREHDEIG
jgi:hypothetical protein